MKCNLQNAWLLILILSLQFTACKEKCGPPKQVTYDLSQQAWDVYPYAGHDTLVFVKNNKDTLTYVGSGRKQNYHSFSHLAGGCTDVEGKYEEQVTRFSVPNNSSNYIEISIKGNEDGLTDYLTTYYYGWISTNVLKLGPGLKDSITLFGKTYKNVSKETADWGGYMINNAQDGLLVLKDGTDSLARLKLK